MYLFQKFYLWHCFRREKGTPFGSEVLKHVDYKIPTSRVAKFKIPRRINLIFHVLKIRNSIIAKYQISHFWNQEFHDFEVNNFCDRCHLFRIFYPRYRGSPRLYRRRNAYRSIFPAPKSKNPNFRKRRRHVLYYSFQNCLRLCGNSYPFH